MRTTYFGKFRTGRLARLPYLGYAALLSAIGVGTGVLLGAGIGLTERAVSDNPAEAHAAIEDAFGGAIGPVGMVLIAVFGIVVMVASLNINAKRFRDIGLPGGWSILAVLLLSIAVTLVLGETASNVLGLIVVLVLLLVPSNAVGGQGVYPSRPQIRGSANSRLLPAGSRK